jgi:gas vesicle protein
MKQINNKPIIHVLKNLSITTLISLSLFACATTGGSGASNKSAQFTAEGCLAGGLVGGLIGALVDDDKVLEGALLGCAAGAIYGFHIADRTTKYANAEQAMDTEISRNRENAQQLKNYNAKLAQGINSYRAEITKVRNAKSAQGVKQKSLKNIKQNLNKQLTKAKSALSSLEKELVAAKKQRKVYRDKVKVVRVNDDKKWQSQIASLEKEKNILSKHVTSLTALNASI